MTQVAVRHAANYIISVLTGLPGGGVVSRAEKLQLRQTASIRNRQARPSNRLI